MIQEIPALQLAIASNEENPRTFERGDVVDIAKNHDLGPATGIILIGPIDGIDNYEVLVGINKHFIHWVYMLKVDEEGKVVYDERVHSMDRIALCEDDFVKHVHKL